MGLRICRPWGRLVPLSPLPPPPSPAHPGSGGCFSPFIPDYYGGAYCGPNYDYPTAVYGCPEPLSKANCLIQNYTWVEIGPNSLTTNSACQSATSKCFGGLFDGKSELDCQLCGEEWRPITYWEKVRFEVDPSHLRCI